MERDYARLHVRLVAIGVELERDVSVADWILSGLEPWGERLSIGILLPGGLMPTLASSTRWNDGTVWKRRS